MYRAAINGAEEKNSLLWSMITIRLCIWRQRIPSYLRLMYIRLHDAMSQKTVFFTLVVTAVKPLGLACSELIDGLVPCRASVMAVLKQCFYQ
jgi:hypothetical protein